MVVTAASYCTGIAQQTIPVLKRCEEDTHIQIKYEGTIPLCRCLWTMCTPAFLPLVPSASLSFLPAAGSSHLKARNWTWQKSQRRQEHCLDEGKGGGREWAECVGQSRATLGVQSQPSWVCHAAEWRFHKCFLASVALPIFQDYEEIPIVCHKKYVAISASACVLDYLNSAILILLCHIYQWYAVSCVGWDMPLTDPSIWNSIELCYTLPVMA